MHQRKGDWYKIEGRRGSVGKQNWGQNSPFLEGVDFFATAKKDQGSVERRSPMFFRRDPAVYCRHYPVFFHKLSLMKKSTPSTEGEFRSRSACKHYSARYRLHPFYRRGIPIEHCLPPMQQKKGNLVRIL